MSTAAPKIYEYRGVKGYYVAKVTSDNGTTYTAGAVRAIAGVSNITYNRDQSVDTHFYNDQAAVVVSSAPVESYAIDASAISLEDYAWLTGAYYDEYTGMIVEGKNEDAYFATGFIYEDTDGNEYYVWCQKGKFTIGGVSYSTKNNSTDANGQSLTFNMVKTSTAFTKNGDGATQLKVKKGLANLSTFFDAVQTPDTILPLAVYELTKTVGQNTSLTITRNGEALTDGDTIYAGDQLKIVVTNGTVTVNGVAFTSGDIHIVTGDTAVVSTYAA